MSVPSDPLRDTKKFEATREALRQAVTSGPPPNPRGQRETGKRRSIWRRAKRA